MEKEKKRILKPIIIISLMILYVIFSFRYLSPQLQMTPEWTEKITAEKVDPTSTLSPLPFKLGQNIGYFTHDGKIIYLKSFPYKACISKYAYCVYDQNAANVKIYDPRGVEISTIQASGFPYIKDNRLFTMLPGGYGFAFIKSNGEISSIYEHTSPLTAFSSSPKATLAGFADGALCLFDENQSLVQILYPAASDYNVILGAAVSSSGTYFASLCGQNKQRFVLYKKENNHCKIVFHTEFDKALTRQTLVYFNKAEDKVYFNHADGLGIVDCNTYKYSSIKIPSKVLNIQESPVSDSIFVLSKDKKQYSVTIIESKNHKTGSFSYTAHNSFILTDQNALFIGKDDSISKFTLSRE